MIRATLAGFNRFHSMLSEQKNSIFYPRIKVVQCMILHAEQVSIRTMLIVNNFRAILLTLQIQTEDWSRL